MEEQPLDGTTLHGLDAYLLRRWDRILEQIAEHLIVVALSVGIAAAIGITIGALVWNRPWPRSVSLGVAGVLITIPSLALLGLLIPVLGIGWTPTVVSLILYALLPIVRNTVVGLREVPAAVMESALGMGYTRTQTLLRVQLPMAWPVIITGIRVATQLIVGIATVAAYVSGPGLGNDIFQGLASLGSINALNRTFVATVCVVLLALLLDALFILVRRSTTPRGIRV